MTFKTPLARASLFETKEDSRANVTVATMIARSHRAGLNRVELRARVSRDRARRFVVARRARADDDDAEEGAAADEDDVEETFARVELTRDQARIAAAALETVYDARGISSATSDPFEETTNDAERVRRRRFEMILQEAVERARASCETDGHASAECATAWETVGEVRDAASRAGVSHGAGTASRIRTTNPSKEDEEERRAKAAAMRETLSRDPLMGSLPCSHMGECTVAEGTLEARGKFMRAFGEGEEDDEEGFEEGLRSEVEAAVTRAMRLCASDEASKQECTLAWEEVEELSNWGGRRRRRRRGGDGD